MICGIHMHVPGEDAGAPGELAGLRAMLAALPGRKTDTEKWWTNGGVGLGWRGDSAAAVDGTRQWPPVHQDAGLAVTASARLDDRAGLCDTLGVPYPQRASLSDGELILRAYARWGRACPDRLLGDYAFAVWDARRRTLFCTRDHVGTRPFYYCLTADRIVFASDVSAVLAAPGVSDELDEVAIATHLNGRGRPLGAHTFFRAVRRLLPGHALTVQGGAARTQRWWRPEDSPPAPAGDDDTWAEAFLELYGRAVRDRLRGSHPVGVHLSGGLDSSSVAVLAARELRRANRPAPLAFGWHPPPGDRPRNAAETTEYGLIEAVALQEGLQVCYGSLGVSDVIAHLRRDVTRDPEVIVHEEGIRCCAAGQGVRVLLSGWGGDEGISSNGRGYHAQLLREGRVRELWRNLRESSRHPFGALVVGAVLPLAGGGAAEAAQRFAGRRPRRKRTFINPQFATRTRLLPPRPDPAVGVRPVQLHLLQLGHLGARMEGWCAGGARHGIDYAYPLLDRRVLEFALGLPPGQFRRGRWSRWMMRHALRSILPSRVCWHESKQDPVRFESFRSAFAAALPVVREILDARSAPPSRSRYVDLPRLREHLDAERFRRDPRPGSIAKALRFLDF